MSKKKMIDSVTGAVPIGAKNILSFDQFVMTQLRKGDRVKEIAKNVVEDFRVAIAKMATVQDPLWDKMPVFIEAVLREHPEVTTVTQEEIDDHKDHAIMLIFIYELMRQYNNFLKKAE
jgi:hypothetical protein